MFSYETAFCSFFRLLKFNDFLFLDLGVFAPFWEDCDELRDRFEITDRFSLREDRSRAIREDAPPSLDPAAVVILVC